MMLRLFSAIAVICLVSGPVLAEQRQSLGWGRMLNNDFLGDAQDRWRTSSYVMSHIRGPEWQGILPDQPGALLEYRLRAEIIAPETLRGPRSNDRAYVGALSFGVHTHWGQPNWQASAGLDVVAIGPQTGLDGVQDWFHETINQPLLGANVIANQVENAVHLTALAELGFPLRPAPNVEIRPFVEAQTGVEGLVRAGVDFRFGEPGNGALDVRDTVTGQRYRAISQEAYGWEYTAGADVAYVADSAYFPAGFGTDYNDTRWRARLGLHWQGKKNMTFFYGATYLSEEYVGQSEGQVVGSIKFNFRF